MNDDIFIKRNMDHIQQHKAMVEKLAAETGVGVMCGTKNLPVKPEAESKVPETK